MSSENHPDAGAVLAAAFQGYPMMRFFFGESHEANVQAMFGLAARDRAENGVETLLGLIDGEVAGVALVEWPNGPETTQEQNARWEALSVAFPEFTPSRFEAYGTLKKSIRPESPHLYVNALATLPNHQGRGIGTAILDAVAEAARPLPVWLDTQVEANCRFYERHGFELRSYQDLDGVPCWFYERPTA